MSVPAVTATDDRTVAVTEVTVAEPEPEVDHVLVLDMSSSAIESRRRHRRRTAAARDDASSREIFAS